MAARFFDHLLESSWHERDRPKRRLTLPASIAVHVLVLAGFVIVPLLTLDDLPEPELGAVRAFFVEATAAAPPPPPPPPPAQRKSATTPKMEKRKVEAPTEKARFVAPMDLPDRVIADLGVDMGSDLGIAGGVPAGVDGGIEGGVIGGVLGGVVGGVLGGVPQPEATPPPPPPTTPPIAQGPVRVGGQIKEPSKTRHVSPSYPDIARQARVQGVVVLEAVINASGAVQDVRVLRGNPLLNEAAVDAVAQWRYTPTLLNGKAVPVIMTVTVNFMLGA